jgi:hypothetical protein
MYHTLLYPRKLILYCTSESVRVFLWTYGTMYIRAKPLYESCGGIETSSPFNREEVSKKVTLRLYLSLETSRWYAFSRGLSSAHLSRYS